MNILSIETSADETGVSVLQTHGDFPNAGYEVLGNALRSQIESHREYGGIFPNIAKREHARALTPLLKIALEEAELEQRDRTKLQPEQVSHIHELLFREPGLADDLISFCEQNDLPSIDLICVTAGPGLEPALWVGVNFAKALSFIWNIPVVSVNHMEGHVLASLFDGQKLANVSFPALSLLISGGHTELILMDDWGTYERIGQTRDDAVGEAYDKVARMLGLPYPGGPELEKLANEARENKLPEYTKLPRPMLHTPDLDFSFSGIKTAVRYAIGEKNLNEDEKKALARDFEDAITEVLIRKIRKGLDEHGAQSLIVGGGVSASTHLRTEFTKALEESHPHVSLYIPERKLSTDNSVMIGLAGHARMEHALDPKQASTLIRADGNRSITSE